MIRLTYRTFIQPFPKNLMDKRSYYQKSSVAETYEKVRFGSASGQLTHSMELGAIKSAFNHKEKLIELACGTGRLLRALQQEGWNVVGIDQSAPMLRQGSLKEPASFLIGDVFNLPIENESFDGAYCFRFTNHYADLSPFFKECYRVLRKGGHFLFDSMRWSPLFWDSNRWGGSNYSVSDEQVKAWLENIGFRIENVAPLFPVGPYILSKLPSILTRTLLKLKPSFPIRLHAVAVWHARK